MLSASDFLMPMKENFESLGRLLQVDIEKDLVAHDIAARRC